MSATYPLAVRTFTQKRNLLDDVDASHINDIQDEIKALETALGVMPQIDNTRKVTYPSVGARLDAMSTHKDLAAWDLYTTTAYNFPAGAGNVLDYSTPRHFVPLKVERGDTDGLFDGTGVKIKRAGWYHVNAGGYFDNSAIKGVRNLSLWRITPSGSVALHATDSFVMDSGFLSYSNGALDCSFTLPMDVGDRIYVGVHLDSWGTSTAKYTVRSVHMHGHMIRDI